MEPKIFHGEISPQDFAAALVGHFHRGNLHVQQFGSGDKIAIQLASRPTSTSGGQTALTISLQKVADGVSVQMGKQAWLGVAASLGMTAFTAWRNPWSLLSRLDDLAQDVEYLQLTEQAWNVIENSARAANASFELSERLRRLVCAYCDSANPVGESNCIACGAPLGLAQPRTCKKCGFVVRLNESKCPNCSAPL